MSPVFLGVAAGVTGTIMMDLGKMHLAQAGILSKIDIGMIGRIAAGWQPGRFRYQDPSETEMELRPRRPRGSLFTHVWGSEPSAGNLPTA